MSNRQVAGTTKGTAAARHDAMVAAHNAQRARMAPDAGDIWSGCAKNFEADPRREPDALLRALADYVRPSDTLLDVGGGAGRLALPLALQCREAVVVDPSPSMGEVFRATAERAGISNARYMCADWLDIEGITGDVALVAHVTYFVSHIGPFIKKLNAATHRTVIVNVRSVPPPNQIAPFVRLARAEDLAPVPGHEELLSVLDELGIAAEVTDLGPAQVATTVSTVGKTRDEAIRLELDAGARIGWLPEEERERVAGLFAERFDELFAETERGFWRRSALDARDLLITWETS